MSADLTRRSMLGAAAFGLPGLLTGQKETQERPDVLFIAADDLNTSLGCYGHPLVKSPNIDRMARGGVRFTRAYCQFPLCGPTRASLMTGLRPDSTRILDNEIAVRDTLPDVVTLPQLFRKNGYRSVRFGKMYHMNVPGSVGTNKWDDPESWDVSISPPGKEDKTAGEGRDITAGRNVGPGNSFHWIAFQGDGKDQADQAAADLAIEELNRKREQPLFLALGLLRPHVPHVAPARFFDMYSLSSIEPVENPANDRDDIPRASEIAVNTRGNDMGMSKADKQEALRGYYASISYMDWQVGRVLDALERTGRARKTVIAFWGDHGWHLGEHFRWQKRSLFEESARAPLIVCNPAAHAKDKASSALVEFVDIYPTLAQVCGLQAPANLEGQSFVPLLDRPDRAWKSAAFTQVGAPNGIVGRSIRTGSFRYTRWEGPYPDEELYDERTDPHEYNNLARLPQHGKQLAAMRMALDAGWKAARARA